MLPSLHCTARVEEGRGGEVREGNDEVRRRGKGEQRGLEIWSREGLSNEEGEIDKRDK